MQDRRYLGKHVRIISTNERFPDEVMNTIKENLGKTGYIPKVDGVHIESQSYGDNKVIKSETIYYKVILDETKDVVIIPGIALDSVNAA